MRHILICLSLLLIFSSCKKDKAEARVDIYLLKSFTLVKDTSSFPVINQIQNAVLEDQPLVADKDIKSYSQSETYFALRTNINSIVKNFGKDKGFAVLVNGQPVYYGWFYPAYLSSVEFGLARIISEITTNSIYLNFPEFPGSTSLDNLDKRNDDRILWAMSITDRLK